MNAHIDDSRVAVRILKWLAYTTAALLTGYGMLLFVLVAAKVSDRGAGVMALVLLGFTLLLFGLSLKQLFWRATIGAVRFGAGYVTLLYMTVLGLWQA